VRIVEGINGPKKQSLLVTERRKHMTSAVEGMEEREEHSRMGR